VQFSALHKLFKVENRMARALLVLHPRKRVLRSGLSSIAAKE
jgi:hypothetical protein